jgi:hypothetical protein
MRINRHPVFSVLHATLGRPHKALQAMHRWFQRAARAVDVEYIFAVNDDDASRRVIEDALRVLEIDIPVRMITGRFQGSAAAWDAAAKESLGDILIQAQDDVEPPARWDCSILFAIDKTELAFVWSKIPVFIAVSDGFRKDKLCCTAIMNRARYMQQGEFLHAGYLSVYSDDEVTLRAYADAAEDLCQVIEARDLVFLHRHHYHDPSVPMDSTYRKENSAEAYAHGQTLFVQRNEKALAAGFRTWG